MDCRRGGALVARLLLPLLPVFMGAGAASAADDDLRTRLTEREDKRRAPEPISIDLGGRPLVLGGEVEAVLDHRSVPSEGSDARVDSSLLGLGAEVEAFYGFGPGFSLFSQLRFNSTHCLASERDDDQCSYAELERGEMWLYSERSLGDGVRLSLDAGRLHFEDDRRWWWDQELDALRMEFETTTISVAIAIAQELAPATIDNDRIDPRDDEVLRVIAEASWDWRRDHVLQLFALRHEDNSSADPQVQGHAAEAFDGSDASLTWVGARIEGASQLAGSSAWGYWLDVARLHGREQLNEAVAAAGQSETSRKVRGWGMDAGVRLTLSGTWEPRLYAGYAIGSGDKDAEDETDHAFRQSALQTNEAGRGGVQRFSSYGVLLAPELSNIEILSLGAGISLFRSSSLDLAYQRYQLVDAAPALRQAGLDLELDGENTRLGDEIDLVLALEEWQRLEIEVVASAFHGAEALAGNQPSWSYSAYLAVRLAF